MNRTRSKELFEQAQQHIPGGVNSPVRAFKSVGGLPVFINRAHGAHLYDEDGNRYIDFINSWGPMILGHAYEPVIKAITARAAESTSFGTPTHLEVEMAELIKTMVPGIDLIRMMNSGTEACMSAIRLARGYTGKNKFIKFHGCYHGHADPFLVKAGSGLATLDIQSVPGVSAAVAHDTLIAPYNKLADVAKLIEENKDQIAAIIVEPVAGNMGCVLPQSGFLQGLRELCNENHIVLIFDEVMTGFRLAPGGAQEIFHVKADLITFGKIIGGGMPVGALGGKKEIMEHLAPLGHVYQAGTLSGNPLAMAAGLTLLRELKNNPALYRSLEQTTIQLADGISRVLAIKGIDHTINRLGSMMSVHFGKHRVVDFNTAAQCDTELFSRFFHHLLNRGVYLPPSAFESWFISAAIGDAEIATTIEAIKKF